MSGSGKFPRAVVHYVDSRRLHAQQGDHLAPGELRDRDHGIGASGGVARLGGEARAELGRGVFAGHHEEVVEGGDGAAHRDARQALIQPVEEIGAARTKRFGQHAPTCVSRQCGAARTQIAMRPVTEIEAYFRVGAGETREDFVRVKSHPGEHIADAVGRVQRDVVQIRQTVYSIPYCFIFR